MNWTEGPATWKQLRYLSHHGYKPEHILTKSEASELIRKFGGDPDALATVMAGDTQEVAAQETAGHHWAAIESARKAVAECRKEEMEKRQRELDFALAKRQDFWVETCQGPGKVTAASRQAHDLYQKQGCRFAAPTRKQTQYILDALDSVMPHWDREHPELFYQTLELNFPELLRSR